jgi:hypothetical protein
MKKIRGNKPIGVMIHTYMEIIHKEIPCVATLSQAKMSCFLFYIFSFFCYKIREQEGGMSFPGGRPGTSGRGRRWGKGGRRVNMRNKCVHM